MHSRTKNVFGVDQLHLFSAQVNCLEVEFYAHLWLPNLKNFYVEMDKLYLTLTSLEDIVEMWKREDNSLRTVIDGQAFHVSRIDVVLSYDQILTAMMSYVFS